MRDAQLRCLSPGDSILPFVPQILLASSASTAWGRHNVPSLRVSGASRGRGRMAFIRMRDGMGDTL